MTSLEETGFIPGEGSAFDYTPEWMNIPKLYEVESNPDPLAVVKLFTPDSSWTWFILEYDKETDTAFGLVVGLETELGYIYLPELRAVRGKLGLRIERDIWFVPSKVRMLPEYKAKWGDCGPYQGEQNECK